MNDRGSLERRLAQLASAGVAGRSGRVLRAWSQDGLPRRLLREIDETIMPRRLTFTAADRGSLVVRAANGRILMIEALDGKKKMLRHQELLDRALDPEEDGLAEALKEVFEALCGKLSEAEVSHEAVPTDFDPEYAGVSVRALAEAWGTPFAQDTPREPADVLDSFVSSTQDATTAWVIFGADGDAENAGDPDRVEELIAFAEARRETGQAPLSRWIDPGEPWTLLFVKRAEAAKDVTAIATLGAIHIYLSLPDDQIGTLADAWRGAIGF